MYVCIFIFIYICICNMSSERSVRFHSGHQSYNTCPKGICRTHSIHPSLPLSVSFSLCVCVGVCKISKCLTFCIKTFASNNGTSFDDSIGWQQASIIEPHMSFIKALQDIRSKYLWQLPGDRPIFTAFGQCLSITQNMRQHTNCGFLYISTHTYTYINIYFFMIYILYSHLRRSLGQQMKCFWHFFNAIIFWSPFSHRFLFLLFFFILNLVNSVAQRKRHLIVLIAFFLCYFH